MNVQAPRMATSLDSDVRSLIEDMEKYEKIDDETAARALDALEEQDSTRALELLKPHID